MGVVALQGAPHLFFFTQDHDNGLAQGAGHCHQGPTTSRRANASSSAPATLVCSNWRDEEDKHDEHERQHDERTPGQGKRRGERDNRARGRGEHNVGESAYTDEADATDAHTDEARNEGRRGGERDGRTHGRGTQRGREGSGVSAGEGNTTSAYTQEANASANATGAHADGVNATRARGDGVSVYTNEANTRADARDARGWGGQRGRPRGQARTRRQMLWTRRGEGNRRRGKRGRGHNARVNATARRRQWLAS
jgi:hypothetical protein